jgi:hypothetical protein
MTYTPNITQLQITNSTTYIDLIGIQVGLPRLTGETADQYVKRLEYAVNLTRTHPYVGSLNEVNIQLGVEPALYISLNLSANTIVTSSIAGVVVGSNAAVPLLTFDPDTSWDWRLLSDVVNDLNTVTPNIATLLVTDGPAFQLARQTNSLYSFNENIVGDQVQLQHSGVQVGTEVFNQVVSAYTLTESGMLTFAVAPPNNTTITYNYVVTPYSLVGSPVALISLTDPEFASIAETTSGVLAYQASEFVQAIMNIDRSYWGE